MKTAEDVLKAVKDIHDQDFPGIRMFEPNMYLFIYPQELAGVRNLKQNGSKETLYYSLDGRRLKSPAKGLNIIRQNDGTTRKVIVK